MIGLLYFAFERIKKFVLIVVIFVGWTKGYLSCDVDCIMRFKVSIKPFRYLLRRFSVPESLRAYQSATSWKFQRIELGAEARPRFCARTGTRLESLVFREKCEVTSTECVISELNRDTCVFRCAESSEKMRRLLPTFWLIASSFIVKGNSLFFH